MTSIINFEKYEVYGAGGYGIVVKPIILNSKLLENKNYKTPIIKLIYNTEECSKLIYEAEIQIKIKNILDKYNSKNKNLKYLGIYVPEIYEVLNNLTTLKNLPKKFLCGIVMEQIIPPKVLIKGYKQDEQVHLSIGYNGNDSDTSWETNSIHLTENKIITSRGFYASYLTIEDIIEDNNFNFTIDDISYTMGKGIKILIENKINPIDVEWVIDKEGKIWMIDFGLCEYTNKVLNLEEYYNDKSYKGLESDIYIPHKSRNNKGWESFYEGLIN